MKHPRSHPPGIGPTPPTVKNRLPGAPVNGKCRLAILSIAFAYRAPPFRMLRMHETDSVSALPFPAILRHFAAMTDGQRLSELLDDCREATLDWTPVYDAFVAKLHRNSVAATAPKVGDVFPDFALPDASGRYRSLAALVADGPTVLSFNRGGWCPFCRGELSAWGERGDALARVGGRLAVITGEVGGRASQLHDLVGPDAAILCDVDHGLALSVGLAFRCDDDLRQRYLACGLDLADIYGGNGWLLPVPATFVIDSQRVVRFAHADPDFRLRADPDEAIARLAAL